MENGLRIENLGFAYNQKDEVISNLNYHFKPEKSYAIIGKSGSGKTTLISLLSGLDRATSGSIFYQGEDTKKMNLDKYRAENVGIIFQSYNLLNNYTVADNIMIAQKVSGQKPSLNRVKELLVKVGLDESMTTKRPKELSGGQQQRVAIARTLAKNPQVLIADEPTGNLDEETEVEILNLLNEIVTKEGKTLIIVTHSNYVSSNCNHVLGISNGKLNEVK